MDIVILVLSLFLLIFKGRMDYAVEGVILLSTRCLGLRNFYDTLSYFNQSIDPALILVFVLLLYVLSHNFVTNVRSLSFINTFILFGIFLLLSFAIDILYNRIDLWSIVRTSRHWLFLLLIIPLSVMDIKMLRGVLNNTMWLTVVASIIIVSEYIFNIHFFTGEIIERTFDTYTITRGALPSTYAFFYLFLLSVGYGHMKRMTRLAIFAVLTTSLLVSATRSIAIGLVISLMLLTYFKSENKIKSVPRMFAVGFAAIVLVLSVPSLRARFLEVQSSIENNERSSSADYRLMMAGERLVYIIDKPITAIFGIGNVTEDNFEGVFRIGHLDEGGDITQLDTADITWALTFLRLGLLGTFIWIAMFISLLKFSYIRRGHNLSYPLICYLLLYLCVLSFAGTGAYWAFFWIIPLLVVIIIHKEENESCSY